MHKIPTKKLSTKKLKPLTYLKYAILLLSVVILPAFVVNDVGMGDPFFCKYICPQGVLEGAIPLSVVNEGIIYTKADNFNRRCSSECAVLPSVLQMDMPTRCILRTDEQGVAFGNEG